MSEDDRSLTESGVNEVVDKTVRKLQFGRPTRRMSIDFKLILLFFAGLAGITPTYFTDNRQKEMNHYDTERLNAMIESVSRLERRLNKIEGQGDSKPWTNEDMYRFFIYVKEEDKDLRYIKKNDFKRFIREKQIYSEN